MFRVMESLIAADPWVGARRPPRHSDEALTGAARGWIRRLPPRRRPLRLCHSYPRVANALAAGWSDVAQTALLLDELLSDNRGGRRGFPTAVTRELKRLREFNVQHRLELHPEGVGEALLRLAAW